ncbi:ABC transporter permease/substrate-binding protein [Saccharicrinis fermentans]|uniref:Osmoprotectant-binding protein n=1 Tax=Saccharicrinis fermentans DSM 9555 = JCM 21142 TaxID=869213 RepID=W7YLU8_9BACT|nr:ABC transporter permease/substrate-binding protein [Saccharicrinis fermentans]GAF03359.1 osmoprotectant-binding protein [Saccharicrinis fermentans DSM 9555 = JCM 21142]
MEIFERRAYLMQLISEHILISFGALTITALVGILVGIWVFYSAKSRAFVMPIVNFLYTIPSIAMFGLLIPLVGIGLRNALIVLVLYGLLPMVRNTFTGLNEVRTDIVEAAEGMGATTYQIFKGVYFPLALPSILSGLRITTVMLVALTGLAALIGAGGLGQAIFRGLNTMNTPMIVTGSLLISLFAILGDRFVGVLEGRVVRMVSHNASRRLKRKVFMNMFVLLFVLLAATVYLNPFSSSGHQTVTVASKPTGEQFILGEIMAQLIEENTDLQVIRKFGIGGGTTNIHPAMMSGEVDMYVEYTGTGWMNVLNEKLPNDNQVVFDLLKSEYEEKFKFKWLGLLGFNNTYALAIPDSLADQFNIRNSSDLARNSQYFMFGAEFDFFERPDGYQGLVDTYGFHFASIHEMDINLRYNAIVQGKVNAIDAFTTDAKIVAQNLRVLDDDLNYFPSYEAGVVIRSEILQEHPELEPLLLKLNGEISTETMMKMNYQVEVAQKDPKQVAASFIQQLKKKS